MRNKIIVFGTVDFTGLVFNALVCLVVSEVRLQHVTDELQNSNDVLFGVQSSGLWTTLNINQASIQHYRVYLIGEKERRHRFSSDTVWDFKSVDELVDVKESAPKR